MRCNHPLRTIRAIANDALAALTADFDALYSQFGRPSIPPEQLPRAMLLQAFYGIRSERQLMERIEFDLLFRWFTGLGVDDPVWDHSTFSKNRDRLLEGEIAAKFLQAVLAQPKVKRLVSNDHFSVDGTLLEAWASMKSFRKTDGSDDDDDDGSGRNGERNFHGEKRSNKTHRSTTDPDAKLYRKGNGQPAKLCYLGHALMENRNGLAVGGGVTQASGTAEREAALNLVERRRGRSKRRITLGADKLGADPTRDVFIGDQVSETAIKRMDLSDRSVVAFATHGLVPGDLDGLTQPALALSSPLVTRDDDDGLLTMGEILGLRLDADWIVLSACNTGSADGAGAEAISGLGKAFFYAGARALLVTNWPVETTSARQLTTAVFSLQAEDPTLSRTQALRQAALSLMDGPGFALPSGERLFSYAHPILWAPFSVVGDGGGTLFGTS